MGGNASDWLWPTFGSFIFWGLWGFIPKITTKYIDPKSAIFYEALGGLLLATIVLFYLNFQLDIHPKGIFLAICTGFLGFLGALCFLMAVARGPVLLVAPLSALYPIVTICLATSFLNETLTLKQGVGIGLALLSVLLVVV